MMRKGAIYTMVAILLVFVVATLFFMEGRPSQLERRSAAAERVQTMDSFLTNLEADSQRAAYVAGYRAFIAMEQQVTSSGDFFADAESAFLEMFLWGSLSGQEFEILRNASFIEYVDRVRYEAGLQGMRLDINVTNVTMWQVEPWSVLVNYTLEIVLNDTRGTASWDIERAFTGQVPITELRDPMYSWGTLSRVQRVIIPTNISEFVDDASDANDTTGLLAHFNSSAYIAAGRGPTMLMRLEGDFSDHPYGIESLVDIQEISAQGIAVNSTASVVDYQYFSGTDAQVCSVQNLPVHLKFSLLDLTIYEIGGKLEYSNC